jgi:hypothetical protein
MKYYDAEIKAHFSEVTDSFRRAAGKIDSAAQTAEQAARDFDELTFDVWTSQR